MTLKSFAIQLKRKSSNPSLVRCALSFIKSATLMKSANSFFFAPCRGWAKKNGITTGRRELTDFFENISPFIGLLLVARKILNNYWLFYI